MWSTNGKRRRNCQNINDLSRRDLDTMRRSLQVPTQASRLRTCVSNHENSYAMDCLHANCQLTLTTGRRPLRNPKSESSYRYSRWRAVFRLEKMRHRELDLRDLLMWQHVDRLRPSRSQRFCPSWLMPDVFHSVKRQFLPHPLDAHPASLQQCHPPHSKVRFVVAGVDEQITFLFGLSPE